MTSKQIDNNVQIFAQGEITEAALRKLEEQAERAERAHAAMQRIAVAHQQIQTSQLAALQTVAHFQGIAYEQESLTREHRRSRSGLGTSLAELLGTRES